MNNRERLMKLARRAGASAMALLLLSMSTPNPVFAEAPGAMKQKNVAAAATPPINNLHVRTGPHTVTPITSTLKFSSSPTDLEISTARVFSEPLAPTTGKSVQGENEALVTALRNYKANPNDLSPLREFVKSNANSRWTPSVELNLGLLCFGTGYLSDALKYWKSAWEGTKDETGREQKAVADQAIAKLLVVSARLGKKEDLKKYFAEVGDRPFFGSQEQLVKGAREGLWMMEHKPECSFKCGPYAVRNLFIAKGDKSPEHYKLIDDCKSTSEGTNLAQVNDLAKKVELNYQMAKRSAGASFITPSVMHWSLGHFACLASETPNGFIAKDPTFDTDATIAISKDALEKETDGYFLVPAGALPNGWQPVSEDEAKTVFGKGVCQGRNPNDMRLPAGKGCCSCQKCCEKGMALASFWEMLATLNIVDKPLSYQPPIGPEMVFRLNYNHLEANQPGSFTFTNLGPDWSVNWVAYMTVDGAGTATIRVPGGGGEVYTLSGGVYTNDLLTQALLVKISTNNYQRQLPDGTIQVFNQVDGSGNIFMTQVIDPQGNSALIQYDGNFRVTSVTDAINQVSTFSYVSNTPGNVGFYKLASIADPFGRSCSFGYDSTTTNLVSITDSIGLVSKFAYDTSATFINLMTTPYGQTSFYAYTPGDLVYPANGLRIGYSDGTSAVVENWINEVKTTYFWDREATMLYPNDPANKVYTHCSKATTWLISATTTLESAVKSTETMPLESSSPITYITPGEITNNYFGTSNKPIQINRFLGNATVNATIGGTITPGNWVNIHIKSPSGLLVPEVDCQYTVQVGDTTSSIAAGLAALVNSNTQLPKIGQLATSNGSVVSLSSAEPTVSNNHGLDTLYFVSTSGGATETINLTSQIPQSTSITIGGTVTPGNNMGITFQSYSPQHTEEVDYLVQAGDTLTTIASHYAANINANTFLQGYGTTATSSGAVVTVTTSIPGIVTFGSAGGGTLTFTNGVVFNGDTQVWQYQYNSFGHVTKSIDPMGRTFTYTYAANGIDLTQITETKGTDNFQIGAWTYNSQHRPLTYTDGSGRVTSYAYNSSGELTTLTDANSNVTTNTYTGTCTATIGGTKTTGNVLTITVHDTGLAGGQKAVPYTVLAGDTLTTIATGLKNAINADTSLQAIGVSATSSGTVITLISNSVNVTTYTQSVTGTETITLGVNTFGYRTKIDGPLSGTQDVTTMTYDNVGRLASQTDSEGYTLIFGYDNADRPTLTTYPDATTEQTIYDKLDAVLTKDRIGRWSQSAYDSMDQLAFEIDPLGRKTKYAWCACGSLHSLTDPAGNVTTWQHDLQGRPIVKTYQDQTTITYGYENCTSRLRTQKDALGQTKYFLYNPDNTNFQTGYKGTVNPTSTVTNTYDPAYKRLASVAKNDWGTYTYTYNPYIIPMGTPTTGGGRLQLVHNNVIANSDITYVYDVLGRTTNRSINGATNSITWAYDAMSRVTSEANALGTFTYAYVDDTPGSSKGTTRLASISYPNSQSTNFSWYGNTQDQRLQTIKNTNPSGGLLSQFDYGYDPAGEITQWQQQQNGNNQFYNLAYDNAGQLTTAQVGSGSPLPPYGQEFYYGYDAASNRTSVQSASCQNVRVGGTVTAANTVTITVVNSALSGGQKAITYTVVGGDTLATIASKLAAAIASDSNLQTAGVTAVASSTLITLRSVSPNVTTYTLSTSGGATETLAFAIFKNGVENATIGGTKTTSNVLTITVKDAGLAGGSKAVNYTVLAGDTLTTIASGIASAINADVNLSAIGVTATSAGTVVSITSTSTNPTTYAQSVSNGSTETITLQANTNIPALATVSGTKTTSDVLTITVFDSGLAGGSRAVPYTVLAGDTLTTIATGLKNAINADTNLQGIGVSATSASTVITINSKSPNATTYRATRSATATEVLTLSTQANAFVTAFVGGTKTTGNVLTLTVFDSGLTTGQQAVTYTVLAGDTLTSIATGLAAAVNANTNLQGIGVSATAVNQIVNLQSTSSNLTTYTKSVNAGGTETITLSSGVGVMQAAYNNVNELVGLSPGGDTRFQGVTNKAIKSASVATQVINVSAKPVNQTSYSSSVSGAATETVAFSANINGNTTATIGGTNTTNDVVTITTFNASLTNGQKSDSYTVQPGDTPTLIATGLKNAINADTSLQAIGVSATSSGAVITITVTGTTYTTSTSGGATETLTLGTNVAGNTTVAVGGTVTNGNTVTVTVHSPLLAGGQRAVTYTVQATDTLVTVAQGLANAMTADTNLQALGVSASNSKAATLAFAESFSGNGTLPTGMSTANVTATDAVPTSKTVGHQIGVASPASSTLTYDANGNMLSDGTNTYSWDAENRLTRITYPGVNNFTDFTFDGFGRNVKIVETTAGSVTSTKQFVWCDDENRPYQFCEERDGSGTLNKMFFGRGQQNTGTKYFYTRDQLGIDSTITATLSSMSLVQLINPAPFLGSVREVTDNTGAVQAQYSYDPYGQVTKLQGNQNSDFQFGGYYQHLRSGLNLTLMRIYSSQFGRWMSRDPLGEGLSMQTRSAFAIEAKKAVLTGEINAEALESGLQNLAPSIDNGSATPKAGEQGINLNTYLKNNPVGSIDPDGRQGLWGWGRILILVLAVLAFLCWLYRKLGGWNRIVGRGRDQPNATTTQPLTPRGSQEKAKETGPQFGDDLH